MARKTIEAWIHETLDDKDKGGKCTRIVLCQLMGTARTEVYTLKLSETGSYDPKALATMFQGKADVHCQDVRGEMKFMLDAYWNTSEVESMMPFTRRGQPVDHHGMTHPPTEEGLLSQKMDWTQKFLGSVFNRQNQMDARQQENEDRALRREEMLFDRVDKVHQNLINVMNQNFSYFNMAKDLMVTATLDQHKQKLEVLDKQKSIQREEAVIKALPMLTNMVSGREIFPQSAIDTQIIEAIARKLTPETVQMLTGGMLELTEEEQGIISHRLNQAMEKIAKEDAHKRSLPKTTLSGEDELSPAGKEGAH